MVHTSYGEVSPNNSSCNDGKPEEPKPHVQIVTDEANSGYTVALDLANGHYRHGHDEWQTPCDQMKVRSLFVDFLVNLVQRLQHQVPGVGEDDEPHEKRHCRVIHQDEDNHTKEILTTENVKEN